MPSPTQNTGQYAEKLAQEYLNKSGYSILATNWQYSHHEIDIIAQKTDILIFVEVKYRKTKHFGLPEESVNQSKIKFISQAALAYIEKINWQNDIRYDIISITGNIKNKNYELHHIEDAFWPTN